MSDLKEGDKFTIEGCGTGKNGQVVIGGINVKTNRKCKAVKLTSFVVKKVFTGEEIMKSIEADSDPAEAE